MIITTAVALTLAFLVTQTALAQTMPPGSVVIPPSQQHGPSLAQMQSDLQRHQEAGQYVLAIEKQIQARTGNSTSALVLAQVLRQMTAEGLINCPAPFVNPGHCFLTPRPAGIAPPIG